MLSELISNAMKINKLALLIILSAATAHGQDFEYTAVDLKGSCPKISYINNFNLPRIVGWWYRVFTTSDIPECFNNEGQTMYASQFNDKIINVAFCCRSAANTDIVACGSNIGSGTCTVTSNPGEFTYEFDNKVYTIYVLDTDYKNFMLIYGCKAGFGRRSRRDEVIYVYSRDYQLNDNLENRVRNVLQRNGIEFSKTKPVKHGRSTPYTPGPRPCNHGKPPWEHERDRSD